MCKKKDVDIKNKYIAANQPYLFPYLGFFQLINSVDIFLLCGDLQYIRHGWVNRNRWQFLNEEWRYFTFSVEKGHHFEPIKNNVYSNIKKDKEKFLKQLMGYRNSVNFEEGYELIREIFQFESDNVAKFNEYSIKKVCDYLSIKTKIICSEDIEDIVYRENMVSLERNERIYFLCNYFQCNNYRNAIGGIKLYNKQEFLGNNLNLEFIKSELAERDCLSVIDYIMRHTKEECVESIRKISII